MKPPLAVDTSVAIPLLVRTHTAHAAVVAWWAHREAALCGHALAETYSVLTRLPRDLRLAPMDAARLLTERFAAPLLLSSRTTEHLPRVLAQFEITGGAVYDALVALAAAEHRAELATRCSSQGHLRKDRRPRRCRRVNLQLTQQLRPLSAPGHHQHVPRPATGHVVQRALPQQRLRAFFVGHVAQGRRRTDPQR